MIHFYLGLETKGTFYYVDSKEKRSYDKVFFEKIDKRRVKKIDNDRGLYLYAGRVYSKEEKCNFYLLMNCSSDPKQFFLERSHNDLLVLINTFLHDRMK